MCNVWYQFLAFRYYVRKCKESSNISFNIALISFVFCTTGDYIIMYLYSYVHNNYKFTAN